MSGKLAFLPKGAVILNNVIILIIMTKDLLVRERPISYQLVGEVRLTKASTGSGTERLTRHIGTETLPGPPRRAAVTNIAQWTKV